MTFITRSTISLFILIALAGISSTLIAEEKLSDLKFLYKCPLSDGFDFPVGKPNAKGYYNAQKFGKNYHLGEDWNGTGGGNSDFGDSVYAISAGLVVSSTDLKGGWGKVVRIIHNYGSKQQPRYLESVYAHLKASKVKNGKVVKRGEKIGSIGNANGRYLAHLHFELRDTINLPIGHGYSKSSKGYLNPSKFIRRHRVISR